MSRDRSFLLKCSNQTCNDQVEISKVSNRILEGSALPDMLKPNKNETFQSYCTDTIRGGFRVSQVNRDD